MKLPYFTWFLIKKYTRRIKEIKKVIYESFQCASVPVHWASMLQWFWAEVKATLPRGLPRSVCVVKGISMTIVQCPERDIMIWCLLYLHQLNRRSETTITVKLRVAKQCRNSIFVDLSNVGCMKQYWLCQWLPLTLSLAMK